MSIGAGLRPMGVSVTTQGCPVRVPKFLGYIFQTCEQDCMEVGRQDVEVGSQGVWRQEANKKYNNQLHKSLTTKYTHVAQYTHTIRSSKEQLKVFSVSEQRKGVWSQVWLKQLVAAQRVTDRHVLIWKMNGEKKGVWHRVWEARRETEYLLQYYFSNSSSLKESGYIKMLKLDYIIINTNDIIILVFA